MDVTMDVFIKINVFILLQHSYFKRFNRLLFILDFLEKVGKRSGIYTEIRTLRGSWLKPSRPKGVSEVLNQDFFSALFSFLELHFLGQMTAQIFRFLSLDWSRQDPRKSQKC